MFPISRDLNSAVERPSSGPVALNKMSKTQIFIFSPLKSPKHLNTVAIHNRIQNVINEIAPDLVLSKGVNTE